MEKRTVVLRVFGTLSKALGVITGAVTVFISLSYFLVNALGGAGMDVLDQAPGFAGLLSGLVGGLVGSILVLGFGGFLALTFFALGEAAHLLVRLDANARATTGYLKNYFDSLQEKS